VSIGGSSDPAIVGKVIRSVLRQMVARRCDGPFNLAEQVQVIATPFWFKDCQMYNEMAAADAARRATLESDPRAAPTTMHPGRATTLALPAAFSLHTVPKAINSYSDA